MRVFIAILILIMSLSAHATQTCDRGYYKPNADSECTACPRGYYCPDDDSDDLFPCPVDTTDWKTLLEGCGYHPLDTIHTDYYSSWVNVNGDVFPAYDISHCYAVNHKRIEFQEGLWYLELPYNASRGDYWTGCWLLWLFYSANPGYYLADYYLTSFEVFYNQIKPCTNAPENAHYTGPGTPDAIDGSFTDKNDCPWECDEGYDLYNGKCIMPLCPAGQYLEKGECKNCNEHDEPFYCPGDDMRYDCPTTDTDYNALRYPDVAYNIREGSWAYSSNKSIYDCYADIKYETPDGDRYVMECTYNGENYYCDKISYFYAGMGRYLSSHFLTNKNGDWYSGTKPCTNAPENAHYTGPGTPDEPVAGGKTDYNDCPWECDDGYGLHDGECFPLCTAGATKFHVGDYVFNIYADKLTTPAINIGLGDGAVCYVPLVEGSGKGALNVDYHGVIYHTSD